MSRLPKVLNLIPTKSHKTFFRVLHQNKTAKASSTRMCEPFLGYSKPNSSRLVVFLWCPALFPLLPSHIAIITYGTDRKTHQRYSKQLINGNHAREAGGWIQYARKSARFYDDQTRDYLAAGSPFGSRRNVPMFMKHVPQ